MLRSTLRFVAGALIGVAVWLYATPAYNAILAAAAEPILNIDSRVRKAEVVPIDRRIIARAEERGVYIPHVLIPADELTYNLILLLALLAMNRHLLTRRGMTQVAIALVALCITHILAVALTLEATYATRTSPWSEQHFSTVAREFWRGAEWSYRLAGMFAIPFGFWWLTRQDSATDRR